jgi:2-dehydro-3-deoxyphosphogluconate aldolase / (4S)-4-hydroxy-2-oxoglutarate aldolase
MLPKVTKLSKMVEGGVVAVIRGVPEEKLDPVAEALVEGGVTALEITVDTPGALEAIKRLSPRLKERAIVGAGTVIDSETARLAISHGAEFIFCPSLHEGVIRTALRYGKVVVPGVMTPTEMITAIEWGADFVKLFPAAGLGVRYLKDVSAPFPHIPVIPTGGVNLDNVASFIEAGVPAVGIGGNLIDKQVIASAQYDKLTAIAAQYVQTIKKARG